MFPQYNLFFYCTAWWPTYTYMYTLSEWSFLLTHNLVILYINHLKNIGSLNSQVFRHVLLCSSKKSCVCVCVCVCIPHPRHVEVPGPEIEPTPQQWLKPLWQQCWILNLLHHKGTSKKITYVNITTDLPRKVFKYWEDCQIHGGR